MCEQWMSVTLTLNRVWSFIAQGATSFLAILLHLLFDLLVMGSYTRQKCERLSQMPVFSNLHTRIVSSLNWEKRALLSHKKHV